MTILDELAAHARLRVEKAKERVSLEQMRELALRTAEEETAYEKSIVTSDETAAASSDANASVSVTRTAYGKDTAPGNPHGRFAFEKALSGPDIAFICEVKKASPSKGVIAESFPYVEIAREYEKAGAECISVLTEPKWFLGSNDYLREITKQVKTPCIRKDFTVDEYMIYEAKTLGASAVLLIVSLLEERTLERYIRISDSLGMSALVEAHDGEEIMTAVSAGARMIGVNNRNLKDFTVDVGNSGRLRSLVPEGILFVAESGIRSAEDVRALREAGADACLVGETLMRADDKAGMLRELRDHQNSGMERVLIRAAAGNESSAAQQGMITQQRSGRE